MLDYETSRQTILGLSRSRGGARLVHWFTDNLGVARGERDRLEIFLPGGELKTARSVVTRLLEHGQWQRSEDPNPVQAARLLLPVGAEYDVVASTVVVELERAGLEGDRQAAFSRCEALIELALARADLATESVVGLWGELYFLSTWLKRVEPSLAPLDAWMGYGPSSRDFTYGGVGLEIKTTLRDTSSHLLSGVHQAEPTALDDRPPEERLLLVSIGLTPGEGRSVVQLADEVDEIIRRVEPDRAEELQVHVGDYGGHATGYVPNNENHPPPLLQKYTTTFVRAYDMGDPAIQVLRSADLQARPHVQTDSVTFRINLPARLENDLNPVVGTAAILTELQRLTDSD